MTGQQGLGHVMLLLPDVEEGHRFFSGVLGFELSDKIVVSGKLNARFYHVNARHHTLAFAECPPGMAGLHHLMLQVKEVDDMGSGHDLLEKYEVPEVVSIGRHSNDRMMSFYCTTPSTFHLEYGYDGLEITPDWVPRVYTRTEIWGHHPHPSAKDRMPALIHKIPTDHQ